MRVAYLLDCFPAPAETFVAEEVLSVGERGVDCRVFSLYKPDGPPLHRHAAETLDRGMVSYVADSTPVACAKAMAALAAMQPARTLLSAARMGRHRWQMTRALPAAAAIRRFKADVVHVHFAAMAAQYALAVNRWTGTPFTVTAHRYDIFDQPPENVAELAKASAGIVSISEFNRAYMQREFGIPREQLPLVHMGVDVDYFAAPPASRPLEGDQVHLVCVALLKPVKGHRYLFEALVALKAEGMDFRVTLAGDGPERGALESLADELGIADRVSFAGLQPREAVRDLVCACDILVLPSLSEGIPVSLMEALACRRPVVATDVCGVHELVEDGRTGRLVPPGDAVALAEAVRWIVAHPEQARALADAGRETVVAEFNRSTCSDALIELWRAACGLLQPS